MGTSQKYKIFKNLNLIYSAVTVKEGTMQEKEKISKHSYIIMLGHLCVDMTQGSLPALLPFLALQHGLSYTSAAGLLFAGNVVSAVSQPLFGYLGDRVERPWFMCAGMLLSAIGLTLMGFFDKYILLCFAALIMGIGTSLFHPEASKLAAVVAGNRRGVGMSIFAVGGNLGFVVGPLIVALLMPITGLRGTVFYLIPVVIIILIVWPYLKAFTALSEKHFKEVNKVENKSEAKDNWKGFTLVSLLLTFKSIVGFSMNSFVAFYFIDIFMKSKETGSINLAISAAAGAIATLSGGWIAEKIGIRRLYIVCFIALPPLLFLFVLNNSPYVATVLLVLISFASNGAHSVMIVTGQNFLPRRMGMASGVLLGLTVSVGGIAAPVIGNIGDNFGLRTAMLVVAFISILIMVISWMIPNEEKLVKAKSGKSYLEEKK